MGRWMEDLNVEHISGGRCESLNLMAKESNQLIIVTFDNPANVEVSQRLNIFGKKFQLVSFVSMTKSDSITTYINFHDKIFSCEQNSNPKEQTEKVSSNIITVVYSYTVVRESVNAASFVFKKNT